jgi:hypothetical protein
MMLEKCSMICIIDVMHHSKRNLTPDEFLLLSGGDLFLVCCTFKLHYTHKVVKGFRLTYNLVQVKE